MPGAQDYFWQGLPWVAKEEDSEKTIDISEMSTFEAIKSV